MPQLRLIHQTEDMKKTERSRTRNLTSPKIQSLHTEGLARYIGVSNSYFKDKFGEPDEKIDSIEGVEWWNYDVNQNDYLRSELINIQKSLRHY